MNRGPYHLKLADGREWQIVADDPSAWVCDGLAHITGLRPSPAAGGRTLAFLGEWSPEGLHKLARDSHFPADLLPAEGWVSTDRRVIEFWHHPASPCVFGRLKYRGNRKVDIIAMEQALYPVIAAQIEAGGLPMHAALVERDGLGVLIAAPGGTGKSTCCRRIPAPWHAVSDDEALVIPGPDGRCRVHPLPTWSEYLMDRSTPTWDIQRHLPLAAIFFLKRAETDEALPLGQGRTALGLYSFAEEANYKYEMDLGHDARRPLKARMLGNAANIARRVPGYDLRASLTGSFWTAMEKILGMG